MSCELPITCPPIQASIHLKLSLVSVALFQLNSTTTILCENEWYLTELFLSLTRKRRESRASNRLSCSIPSASCSRSYLQANLTSRIHIVVVGIFFMSRCCGPTLTQMKYPQSCRIFHFHSLLELILNHISQPAASTNFINGCRRLPMDFRWTIPFMN